MHVVNNGAVSRVGAYRAYIKLSEIRTNVVTPAPGRRRIAMEAQGGKQNPTALEEALSGNEQLQKVMMDGKLYIIRGGHIYDATGRLVK
jgi:hypothetical protein